MKKKVLLVLVALMAIVKTALAYDFSYTYQGKTLYYNISGSTVTVVYPGIFFGNPYSGYTAPTGNLTIPSSVTYNGSTYTVTSIGDYSFYYCADLTSVAIPNSVTSIGEGAFRNCNSLTSVYFNADSCVSAGNSNTPVFSGCSNLTTFTFGNNVKYIPDYLCKGCVGLTSVIFNADSCVYVSNLSTYIFNGCSNLTNITFGNNVRCIPNRLCFGCTGLTSVTIPNSVTLIGNQAFFGCSGLTSVTIGNGVTSIGSSAFQNCSGLTSVTIPNSVISIGSCAFCGCTGLTSVTIPNSVTLIGNQAFFGCSGLTSVTIGNGVTSVGCGTFYNCSGLTSITIPNSVTSIGSSAFYGCNGLTSVTIPNSVISIGSCAFCGCTGLTSVTIPNSVTLIGNQAFFGCSGLTSVTIGNGVTSVGCGTFYNCSGLTSITIPNSVTSIGSSAFYGCNGLTSVTIPNSVTLIGMGAFYNCNGLTSVIFNADSCITTTEVCFNPHGNSIFQSSNLTTITFGNTVRYIPDYLCKDCLGLTSITIPNSVTSIGNEAFYGCSGLTSVTIGNGVTSIGSSAFNNCSGLTSITIPNSVTSIGSYAFTNCSGLTSVIIGNSVTSIGNATFRYCSDLDTVYMMPYIPPLLGSYPFADNAPARVFILNGCSYDNYYTNNSSNPWYAYSSNLRHPLYDINFNVSSSDSTHGTATVVMGPDNRIVRCDSTVVVLATSNYGYHFTHWNDGNTDNPRTLIVTQDTSFTAFFGINTYTVTVQSSDTIKGSVSGSTTTVYLDSTTISATANYGYHFTHWNDGNTDNPRTITLTQDTSFTAFFDFNTYTVTVQSSDTLRGSVSGSTTTVYLDSTTISATANYGYHFTHWNDGNTDNPRTITLTQDTSFTAFFDFNTYTVTVQSSDTLRGSVSGSTTTVYLDSTTISATANYGYHFTHWNDGNTDNPRMVQVTNNTTYTAYFDYDQFNLTVQSDNTAQGYVSGGGSYNYLSNRTITATPTYGHHFTYWNDGLTENPRTITLTQDTTFTAHFAPNQYTLTVNAGEHGTAIGSGTYNFGDTIIIQAFPEEHYHFTRWNDGNTENPRQYRIEDNISLTAFFAIDTHTVVVTSSDIVRGMAEASGTEFAYGTPCTVTATAYTGYTFAGWSNGVTSNPYTFAVISDVELTALFVEEGEEVFTVTVESADPTMGTVSGGGQALNGGTVTISAIPNDGYRFLRWNDGNTENPRTVTVTRDITYTAYFESIQGIGDVDALNAKVYINNGQIVVEGSEGAQVWLYDINGRLLATKQDHCTTLRFDVQASGTYLVKIGNHPARRIVVIR